MKAPVVERVGEDDTRREQDILARMYSSDSNLGQVGRLNRLIDPASWITPRIDARLVGTPRAYGGGEGIWITQIRESLDYDITLVEAPKLVLHIASEPQEDQDESEGVEEVFNALMDEWRDATKFMSSPADILLHPAHLKIIGLGSKAIPLLLHELQERPYHLFAALGAITRENLEISEDKGRTRRMTEAWLAWGRKHGYL